MKFNDDNPVARTLKAALALVLSWAVPGSGHAFVGRPVRGIIIFIVIGATFWAGIAMGGVMTVDHRGQKWWFAAEMLTGVHGLVGWQRESKQLEMLDAQIQTNMATKRASLNSGIRNRRRELQEYHTNITRIKKELAVASTPEEKDTLGRQLQTQEEARDAVNRQILGNMRQLLDLRNAHTTRLLSQKNLALVAPMATLARAYAGVAGLLNLMCMFDVVMLALIGNPVIAKEEDQQ